ncbi:unnamed protein product [Lactuca saligna]|uniref:Uncharacterized protein n=1 Tax=Lactuca saligna TaxID=75948 RepID=A0AA35VN40_LACSI|nr:unnamed protein product [Lactuca saligna]
MLVKVQGSVNPRDTSVRFQGIDDIDLNDSWSTYQPTNEAEAKKYATFHAINNANTISTILKVQEFMDKMADMIRKAQSTHGGEVDRTHVSNNANKTAPYRETHRYGSVSETPMHPSRTRLHPYMMPMRDSAATPIHDGMRTRMCDKAWNPYAPMSPSSPRSRAYEAPTLGSRWANSPSGGSYSEAGTPRDNRDRDTTPASYGNAPRTYLPSTPGEQPPMTPSLTYLPGTPGGQPMTPGVGGLDMMSRVVGGDNDGPWFLPDILVNVRRSGEDAIVGVIREVLLDGACRVVVGGDVITANPNEIEVVVPRKSGKIKIMGGPQHEATWKLIGVDGTDGIVKVDDNLDVKILDMVVLAKLAP